MEVLELPGAYLWLLYPLVPPDLELWRVAEYLLLALFGLQYWLAPFRRRPP
jgi:hypothetical protein